MREAEFWPASPGPLQATIGMNTSTEPVKETALHLAKQQQLLRIPALFAQGRDRLLSGNFLICICFRLAGNQPGYGAPIAPPQVCLPSAEGTICYVRHQRGATASLPACLPGSVN